MSIHLFLGNGKRETKDDERRGRGVGLYNSKTIDTFHSHLLPSLSKVN